MLNKLPLAVYPIGMGCVSGMPPVTLLPSGINNNDWHEFVEFAKLDLLPEILIGESVSYHLFVETLKRGIENELLALEKKDGIANLRYQSAGRKSWLTRSWQEASEPIPQPVS